jgi:flagellar protein FliS
MNNNQLSEYRRAQILGMSQIDLVVMLYHGAIRFLNEAIELVKAGRFDQSWQKFDRSRRIVIHLCGTLNRDAGDLADKFASLYAFVIEQIGVANARKDIEVAQNCISVLTTLKEGWEGLAAEAQASVPAETGATEANQYTENEPLCVEA